MILARLWPDAACKAYIAEAMFTFTDDERALLADRVTTDAQGHEILIGLTLEETAWFMEHAPAVISSGGRRDPDTEEPYLELFKSIERARLVAAAAESELRHFEPTKHEE